MNKRVPMRGSVVFLSVMAVAVLVSGCILPKHGSILFDIDLEPLEAAYGALKGDIPAITGATVTLFQDEADTIVQDLAVSGGHATGTINDLAEGYWHVKVDVYSGATKIFTGEQDVNVIAGLVVNATILFDPVVEESQTGSIAFEVGLNPVPGYRFLDQAANTVLYSPVRDEIYFYDAEQCLIAVHNGETFNRVRDIEMPQAPRALCLAADGNTFVLGYTTGQVYSLGVDTGEFTLLGDALMDVRMLAAITPGCVLAVGPGSSSGSALKTFNTATGQILASQSVFYSFQDIVYNTGTNTAYAFTTGVSPADLYRIKLDPATGAILEVKDSRYHGDYNFGAPVRLIRGGQRIATSSGNMFSCTALTDTDITYAGNIGQTYADLAADDALGYLSLVTPAATGAPAKLIIVRQDNFFVVATVDLPGKPKSVINTAGNVVVTVEFNGQYYAKAFSKAFLGL